MINGQVWLKPRLDIIIGYYVTKELIQLVNDRMSMLVRDNHDVLLDANLDLVNMFLLPIITWILQGHSYRRIAAWKLFNYVGHN